MAVRITAHLVDLTYEAALKSYWRKSALRKFLRSSHISDSFLGTWSDGESKREFLDRLFERLQRSDRGKKLIYEMAISLSEQTVFPDLRSWEDSDQKIADASKAVAELKANLDAQKQAIVDEREREKVRVRAREERASRRRAETDKNNLRERLDALFGKIGTQSGGYDFEGWFYDFLDFWDLDNRRPYVSSGRQIDGSLTHEGTTYLVELKFRKDQSGSTDIDSIKAKVESKADNTMGILVSMAGFSSVSIQQASGKRGLLLLLDARHIYLTLTGAMTFPELISRIRRHASQVGEAYLSVESIGG